MLLTFIELWGWHYFESFICVNVRNPKENSILPGKNKNQNPTLEPPVTLWLGIHGDTHGSTSPLQILER